MAAVRLLVDRWVGFRVLVDRLVGFRVLLDRWLGFRLLRGRFGGFSGFKAAPVYHRAPSATAVRLAPRLGARPTYSTRPDPTRGGPLASAPNRQSETLVFIPALDEEESVGDVIRAVRGQLPGTTILVIDDGSTDRTSQEAAAAGAEVAVMPFNAGLGAALQTGYRYALREEFGYFAHLDGDGQHPPSELLRILQPVWDGRADLIVGSRFALDPERGPGFRSSPLRRFWIILLGRLVSATSGGRFSDITSGFRAGNRRAIELFAQLYEPDFGEIEALQSALKEGLEIDEVPVLMIARETGTSYLTAVPSFLFVLKSMILIAIGRFRGAMR